MSKCNNWIHLSEKLWWNYTATQDCSHSRWLPPFTKRLPVLSSHFGQRWLLRTGWTVVTIKFKTFWVLRLWTYLFGIYFRVPSKAYISWSCNSHLRLCKVLWKSMENSPSQDVSWTALMSYFQKLWTLLQCMGYPYMGHSMVFRTSTTNFLFV